MNGEERTTMLKPEEYFDPLPPEDRDTEFIAMESRSFGRNSGIRFQKTGLP